MDSAATIAVPRQDRSRLTAQRFIDAATQMLRTCTFADLSVANLARTAERSVGSFYQRFGSKDDFLIFLLKAFFDRAEVWRKAAPAFGTPKEVYLCFLRGSFDNIAGNRNLWHAGLSRSASEPEFWDRFGPVRENLHHSIRMKMEEARGAPFSPEELHRLAVANQVFNSVINNQIINAPGPLDLDDPGFFDELSEIVMAIAPLSNHAGSGAES